MHTAAARGWRLVYRRRWFGRPRREAYGSGEHRWLVGWGDTREAAREMALLNVARSSAGIRLRPD